MRQCFETRVVGEQARYNSQLISNILNTYFGMSVLIPTKEQSHIEGQNGFKKTNYKMIDGFFTIKNEFVRHLDRGSNDENEYMFSDPDNVNDGL